MKLTERQRDWVDVLKLWVRVVSFYPASSIYMMTLMDPYVQQCYRNALKEYNTALNAYNEKYKRK